MTEKDDLREAFQIGFAVARKSTFRFDSLGPVSKRTANTQFEQWHDLEKEE